MSWFDLWRVSLTDGVVVDIATEGVKIRLRVSDGNSWKVVVVVVFAGGNIEGIAARLRPAELASVAGISVSGGSAAVMDGALNDESGVLEELNAKLEEHGVKGEDSDVKGEELELLVKKARADVVVFAIDWVIVVDIVAIVDVIVVVVVTISFAGGNFGREKWKLPRIE